jgi:PPOX class probable FMN-dependent enzyme
MTSRINKLREVHGSPSERTSKKIFNSLNEKIKEFITNSPFAVLSSADKNGNCDASPRGGLPGFIKILDDQTLFIPDIKGNRLFQSFENFNDNPKAGLLFLIPGNEKMVRVNGRVSIIEKEEMASLASKIEAYYSDENSELIQGFKLHVDEAYSHCSRAIKFSDLWISNTGRETENP